MTINDKQLKMIIPAAGLLGALLRCVLYLTGTDEKGLLVTGHWAQIAIWLLTAAAGLVLALGCVKIRGPEDYKDCYPHAFPGCVGCFAAAVALVLTALPEWVAARSPLDSAAAGLSFAAAGALVYAGIFRLLRRKPYCSAHAVVCVCFAVRMVCQYRVWSSDPQLLDYCFYMAAHVGLMLTAYHLAAFDAGMGSHRALWFFGLATVYFCLLCLWGGTHSLLMLCCGIWALTNLTELKVRQRRVRPVLKLDSEGEEA